MSEEKGLVIEINMDKRCVKCGEKGAMPNGYCLKCAGEILIKNLKNKKIKK